MFAPFIVICVLLLIGFVLRSRLSILRRFFIPASVVGGFVGLACVQASRYVEPLQAIAGTMADQWRSWPGPLIAVVFAGMLLDRPVTNKTTGGGGRRAVSEGIVVWIIILGQIVLGYTVTATLLAPLFGTPLPFGQLLEVSWAGGFGAAAAWGNIYERMDGLPAARDLAFFFAAAGLLYGTISGIVLVNIAIRMGWTHNKRLTTAATSESAPQTTSADQEGNSTPAAYARVSPSAIDPLAFQLILLALAFATGALLQWSINLAANGIDERQLMSFRARSLVENLPLFLFTLIGGWIVRRLMQAMGVADLIDPLSIRRLTTTAMEVLIVAAVASMRSSALASYGVPSLILMTVGAAWCAITLFWLSRKLLPTDYWLELGAINYGMATATTAQGMVLLRIVDRDRQTGAAADYALAAPMSAPFIGGGVITMMLPAALLHVHVSWIIAAGTISIILLYAIGRMLAKRRAYAPVE